VGADGVRFCSGGNGVGSWFHHRCPLLELFASGQVPWSSHWETLKARPEKEARVDDLGLWDAPSWILVRDGGSWCDGITFLHVVNVYPGCLGGKLYSGINSDPPFRNLLFLCRNLPRLSSGVADGGWVIRSRLHEGFLVWWIFVCFSITNFSKSESGYIYLYFFFKKANTNM